MDVSDNLGAKEEAGMDYAREPSTRLKHKLPRLGGWAPSIFLILGLIAILGSAACQDGLPDTTAEEFARELPVTVTRGEEFAVTITFTSPEDGFHAIGLTDAGPAGWDVSVDVAWTEPQAMAANTPGTEKAEYIWEGPHDAGVEFTAEYSVRVPADAEPGDYAFSGRLEYYIEPVPAPSYEEEIVGDVQVTVS
jgi:hypothetical protein